MELKNIAWQEKYRPQKVSDVVSDSREKILKYLESPESIPNFLFISRTPGTGKTTMAKAIIKELDCNYCMINSSDERGIDTVRETIKNFAKTISTDGKRKCAFLDEADGLTKQAQESLRNLMETYSSNIFFILTCNYVDKIIEPLQSRCVSIEFNKPDKIEIRNYLIKVLNNEGMQYTTDAIDKLIGLNYPSIRNCINYLQDLNAQDKELTIANVVAKSEEFDKLWSKIKRLEYSDVIRNILENNVDVFLLNNYFFDKLIEEKMIASKQIKIINYLADNEKYMKGAANPHIIFFDNLGKIALALK